MTPSDLTPVAGPAQMPDRSSRAPASSSHEVGAGIALTWGFGPFATAASDTESVGAVLMFVLTGETASPEDRMIMLRVPGDRPSWNARDVASGSPFHVALSLAPEALAELCRDERTPGAAALRAFLAGAEQPPLAFPLPAAARLAVESIRRCPFGGACRAMALTARAHDLLIAFLTAVEADARTSARSSPPRRLVEQVRAAAVHLEQNLELPPSLAELARRVGLSETSLKRGFPQVMGTTAFGFLRTLRMERARALLATGEATVLEAAARVGYSNPSNFAAAFRRQFGLNPKEFQLSLRP